MNETDGGPGDDRKPMAADGIPMAASGTAQVDGSGSSYDAGSAKAEGVLVPSIRTASCTAAVRSLGRKGIRPLALSEDPRSPAFDSTYCAERMPMPDPEADLDAYETALLALARRDDVATVFPFRELDVFVLARNRETLSAHLGTPWPTLETLGKVQDRMALVSAAQDAGVTAPATRPLDEWNDWSQRTIVKPRYTVHAPEYDDSFETTQVRETSTEYIDPNSEPDRSAILEQYGHEPIVQEYVPSTDEYGFFALYDEGTARATFQHRQRRGWKYSGGPSAYRESVAIPELEEAGLALLDELEWHGVAMVEFLYDPVAEEFTLMEINPRFWSSLPFTIQAGVDFPYLCWLQATDRPLPDAPTYREHIGGHFLWGEFLHLHSILTEQYPLVERPSLARTFGDIAKSIVAQPRFDYLDVRDPMPFVRDLRNSFDTMGRGRM